MPPSFNITMTVFYVRLWLKFLRVGYAGLNRIRAEGGGHGAPD